MPRRFYTSPTVVNLGAVNRGSKKLGSIRVSHAKWLTDRRQAGSCCRHRAGCRQPRQDGEVVPGEGAVEVLGGDAAAAAEEGLRTLVAAVDGVETKLAAAAFTGLAVERLVADAQGSGTGRKERSAVGDRQRVVRFRDGA